MKYPLNLLLILLTSVVFGQAPTANFSASPLVVCVGTPINFTDASTPGASPIASRTWDFGDGGSSTLTNPTHTYTTAGTYTVTLVVTAQNGAADPEVKPAYITVNPLPQTSFLISGNGCTVPFDVTFTNTSVTGSNINYAWNFGNGQTSTATNPPPVTYNSAGTFPVTLTVTNTTTGCVNTITDDIVVSNFAAGINAPSSICVGTPIVALDQSTVGANQWNWSFGNGQTSTSQNPSITYNTPGTYTISLSAQNANSGCQDATSQTITVNPLPTPSFTPSVTTGCAPLSVNFTNNSPGGSSYTWSYGDGTTATGFNPGPHVYTSNGTFSVTLTMIDANGCPGVSTLVNLITISAPTVEFSMDQIDGCAPLTVQFSDLSTSPNPTSDPIVSWTWNFGDGSAPFTGQNATHTYVNTGVYSVSLTATTQNGCQGVTTYIDTIEVGGHSIPDFTMAPPIDCAKSQFQFTNLTTFIGTPNPGDVEYFWDYGDGGSGYGENPLYQYPLDTGYFDVQLIVDWNGCQDTITYTDIVYVKAPIAGFIESQTLFCNPSSFPVTLDVEDISIVGTVADDVEMIWEWGDGTSTYFDDPDIDDFDAGSTSHDYFTYGTYEVEQFVYNFTTGCEDSITSFITISETVASFTLSNDSTCLGTPITITNTSTSTHPLGIYNYNMGLGWMIDTIITQYNYPSAGSYDITLTATNFAGCSDTETFTGMDVLSLPQAIISPSDVAGCAPITVTYTNNSAPVGNGVPLESFFWTYPDLSTQTIVGSSPANYTFTTEGTFTTTMVATDQFGCVSSPTAVNMTITKPSAAFILDSVVCDEENFIAQNQSTGATSYQWFVDGSSEALTNDFPYVFDETPSPSYNHIPHVVSMIATDQNGCQDTMTQAIIVSLPVIDLNFTFTGASVNGDGDYNCPPVFASFTDGSDSYGSITSWAWDFGDGKFSTFQNPNNTYVFPGTYTSSFSIVDEFGCTADTTLIDYLTIFGPTGIPMWTSVGDLCKQVFIFEADSMQNVTDIIWTLGDGTIFDSIGPFTYEYGSYQTFNPSVILIDTNGCEVPYELPPIYVINNGLNASFVPNPSEGEMGTNFVFIDQSTFTTAPIDTWTWNLGTDTIYNISGTNINYNFGPPGTYAVTLIIADTNGCFDEYTLTVTVTNEFHLPNVFTPNGDGVNEFFEMDQDIFESFDIAIINRWGNVVHERKGATGTYLWDGKTQGGDPVVDGVYFYRLSGILTDGTLGEKHGNVTVFNQ